ncbi:hypothetical protein C0584_01195 [Candidatus Parcubacteria bacterium]|nr:MAG: hypothetical protein C0584_01195 [Candidatus Parcubacteria bacterium]
MKIDIKKIGFWDIFLIINLISLFGAVIYKVYALNTIAVILSLLFSYLAFTFLQKLKTEIKVSVFTKLKSLLSGLLLIKKLNLNKDNISKKIFSFLYLCVYLNLLYILFTNTSVNSITSPWQVIPSYFFIFYLLLTTLLFFVIKNQSNLFSLFFVSLHYFLSFSIAIIVYKIGYGFDPFVHEATLDIIKEKGFVDPKPLYYLGQYSLIIILNKLLFVPISFLNKFLVPILASVFLPRAILDYLNKQFTESQISLRILVLLLILPFSLFIMTTPQNLAYLLLLIIIIKSIKLDNLYDLASLYVFSLVALVTQPIAGIPALLFVLLISFYYSEHKFKKLFISIVLFFMAISLPLSFFLFQNTPETKVKISNNFFASTVASVSNSMNNTLTPVVPNNENAFLNFIYFYSFNLKFIILLLVFSGIYLSIKNKKECKIFIHYLLVFLTLFIAYLLTSSLDFSFLVDYERSAYSERILLTSSLFLLPFILLSFYYFLFKLQSNKNNIKVPVYLFIGTLILSSLYTSYPRLDNYHNSHGISVGQYDIEATKWIEDNNRWQYIVLANQQVSASALKNFGFNKYFSNNIFYYPIPTSSPLYEHYLNMVYDKPSRENALKALDLVNINELYFVLNKYWWAFPKLLEEAKLEADSFKEFGDGDVYVFKYIR